MYFLGLRFIVLQNSKFSKYLWMKLDHQKAENLKHS